jgi:hypothetical protein
VAEAAWSLARFEQRLDEWLDLEAPPDDVRRIVTAWTLTRLDDPFVDAQREAGFPNLWSVRVPGSIHAGPTVVLCAYWIHLPRRLVVCESFGSLGYPA